MSFLHTHRKEECHYKKKHIYTLSKQLISLIVKQGQKMFTVFIHQITFFGIDSLDRQQYG